MYTAALTIDIVPSIEKVHSDARSCPLHISLSDAPIRLRCCRRQIGAKPCDTFPTSRWDRVHICQMRTSALARMVKESYLLQLPLKDSCIAHIVQVNSRYNDSGYNIIPVCTYKLLWSRTKHDHSHTILDVYYIIRYNIILVITTKINRPTGS